MLSLFTELPEVRELLENDKVLKGLSIQKQQLIDTALKNCGSDYACYSSSVIISDAEIKTVGERLAALYKTGQPLDKLIKDHLIPSGCYILYADLPAKEMLVKAWEQEARAVNHTIAVYVNGEKPNYPNIDSISFNVRKKSYSELVAVNLQLARSTQHPLFFTSSMQFALEALELNGRKEAADYEPMTTTVNKAAIAKVANTSWSKYPYSVILVPGEGPEDNITALSAGGMLRCRLAANQYNKGMAPFIVVSGGRVHPYRTKYSEAFEMKEFLINELHIPESAIIMEPHARHTTTNMRNCVRLLFRYGMPLDKPALTVTIPSQSFYISETLLERCKKELGYYPYKNGKRLSSTEMEFYPDILSLQLDNDEPLDP
ncbi:YdcF family protein [Chitinophaga silvatica]|uniref:YdcF family protein n=1 Tax=Chitinophaga silvatica TaxID=2282649 RepID=A0A3E1YAQ8_9BACT|nr:YdcF family protein [Chitinophaga silvatica]